MMIASPAFAQDTLTTEPVPVTQEAPAAEPAAPVTDAAPAPAEAAKPATNPEPATAAAQPTPSEPATEAQPATAAATPPPGQPATSENQVAAVVTKEFPTYDKDSSGSLDKAEFGAWMVALRTAAQPTFKADSAEATTWISQAFAQADKDKNATINQGELTVFLTPKPA